MKRILTKILVGALSVCMLVSGLIGCGAGASWKSGDLKSGGALISDGGFLAETQNYLYYINGIANSGEENAFGVPVKGALMAVDKADLSKTEVVVPKLFVASDYEAGLFIHNDYVYYGTPNVEKNSSGQVAKTEMTFMRTKLDGSAATDEFFTVTSLSDEYRFVENDGKVYIVYYDSAESALISYDTTTKTSTTIIKKDDKADELSLVEYKFVDEDGKNDAVVLYTVTIYTEPYEEKGEGYTRETEEYNQVYAYTAGDAVGENGVAGKLVIDGKPAYVGGPNKTIALKLIKDGYVFYTETANKKEKTFAITSSDLMASGTAVEVVNTAYVAQSTLIVSLDEVYTVNEGKVYKSTMIQKENEIKKCVAVKDTISTLLFIKDTNADGINDTIYYYNSSNQLAKYELKNIVSGDLDKEVKEIRLSEDTVATTWYDPEMVTIAGKTYLFYADNSSFGASYVKYFDMNVDFEEDVIKEDTDDDDENDLFYLDTDKIELLGKVTDRDAANIATARINLIAAELDNGVIKLEEENGVLLNKKVDEVKAYYDEITDSAIKSYISTSAVETLNKYIKAIEIANLYNKLKGIENCLNEEDAEPFKTAYDLVKADLKAFKASADRETIDAYISNNLKSYYTKAVSLFEAEE